MTGPHTLDERVTQSPAAIFADALKQGRLLYQRCSDCGEAVFHPRLLCRYCASTELVWEESGGRGTLYSATVVRSRSGDHSVALIDLDEGFRMMARVTDTAATLGDRVRAGLAPGMRIDDLDFSKEGDQ